jgi:hypothetical protein
LLSELKIDKIHYLTGATGSTGSTGKPDYEITCAEKASIPDSGPRNEATH